MYRSTCIFIIVQLFSFAFVAYALAQPSFDVILEFADQETFLVGEKIEYDVMLKNLTTEPLTMILPVDGSSRGRYPQYIEMITYPLPVYHFGTGIYCGTLNPLEVDDFVVLEPLGEVKINRGYYFAFFPFTAGEYQLKLTVSTDVQNEQSSELDAFYANPQDPELMELFAQVPRETVQSVTHTIRVVSNGITIDERYHSLIGMTEDEMKRNFEPGAYLKQSEVNASIYTISMTQFHTTVHLDADGIIDGVKMPLYNQKYVEEYLKWHRGGHDEIPYTITFNEPGYSAGPVLRTGYFATQSSVEFADCYR